MQVPESAALVLLAARERDLLDDLEARLRRAHFRTERVSSFGACLEALRRLRPDVVVLSDRLEDAEPGQAVAAIRSASSVPLLVLAADGPGGAAEEVRVLALGADDVVDPERRRELVLEHLRAVLRRIRRPASSAPLRCGPLVVDPQRVSAEVRGVRLRLTLAEFRVLEALARAPGRVMRRSELLETCLPESHALERVVDTHVKNLRAKLAPLGADGLVETVRGVGYRLRDHW